MATRLTPRRRGEREGIDDDLRIRLEGDLEIVEQGIKSYRQFLTSLAAQWVRPAMAIYWAEELLLSDSRVEEALARLEQKGEGVRKVLERCRELRSRAQSNLTAALKAHGWQKSTTFVKNLESFAAHARVRFQTEADSELAPYAKAWASLRRRQRWGVIITVVAFGLMTAALIARPLGWKLPGSPSLPLVAFMWWLILALGFKCPRCNKPFFRKDMLAKRCANCGLPKWSANADGLLRLPEKPSETLNS
jgi:hypothetical protein